MPTAEFDLEGEIDDLSNLLERTKVLYEQYFMGIQKRAPEVLHRQVERRMRKIMQIKVRNTGLRFRFQTLSQKYGSYNTYWRRTMRAIEQGRYTRHIAKAGRRAAAEGKEMPAELLSSLPKRMREKLERDRQKIAARHGDEAEGDPPTEKSEAVPVHEGEQVRAPKKQVFELGEDDLDLDNLDIDAMFSAIKKDDSRKQAPAPAPAKTAPAGRPAAAARPARPAAAGTARPRQPASRPAGPTTPRPAPRPAPRRIAASAPAGMSEKQTRELYDRFVQAKKLVGADTSKLSYERMVKTLNKQAPKIMQQHKAQGVKFDVVIKDNGVILKAKPVKG